MVHVVMTCPMPYIFFTHFQLYVHYASDDRWLPESKMLKYNEANLQKQKELQSQHSK